MKITIFGSQNKKTILMLPGSFCNSISMQYLIDRLSNDYYLIIPEYNGHFENSTFTTRQNEASEIIKYLKEIELTKVDIIYGQSMGAEIGIELIH